MTRRRHSVPNKKKLRNLTQFESLTDAEFEDWFAEKYGEDVDDDLAAELEERIAERLAALAEDYDLDDMKANDREQLRGLIMAMIQLEDLEQSAYQKRQDVADSNILTLEKLNRIMSQLRGDISKISEDLQLTKKVRSSSKEISIAARWDELTRRAHEFYRQKHLFIFCPECRMLLATVWLIYPEEETTQIKLHCKHCKHTFITKLAPLYATGNRNLEDVVLP